MYTNTQDVTLIVRGAPWGVQLDVKSFPVYCPSCQSYLPERFEHRGSRYGLVGSIQCACGDDLNLTDGDNIVEFIAIHGKNLKHRLEFDELFQLGEQNFGRLKAELGYDVFTEHAQERITLGELLNAVEEKTGADIIPLETAFPASDNVKRWMGLQRQLVEG